MADLPKPTFQPAKTLVANSLRGFAMGTADLVPGVSGATIALLLGIYRQFIQTISQMLASLSHLLRGNFPQANQRLRQISWRFILPLLAGIVVAVFTLAPVMSWLLDNYPEAMAGVFSGIVLASIAVAWQNLAGQAQAPGPTPNSALNPTQTPNPTQAHSPNPTPARWLEALVAVAVAVGIFILLGFSAEPRPAPALVVFFGSGAIAVCAMVLPGISGAFLLLIVGMYGPVIDAVSDRELGKLLVLLAGVAVGIAAFVPLLKHFLETIPRIANAVLLGLLLGSLRVLWPWPDGVGKVSQDSQKIVDGTRLNWPTWQEAWLPGALGLVCLAVLVWLQQRPRLQPAAQPRTAKQQ